jgi:HYR domain-containing protein
MARLTRLAVAAIVLAMALVPLASGQPAGTFSFQTELKWFGGNPVPCPSGVSPTTACYPHSGGDVSVGGLGFVSEYYIYAVETDPGPSCDGFNVLGYTATLSVRGKGDIFVSLGPVDGCLQGPPSDTVLSPTQPFTITGGSGRFAGASGSGVLSRANAHRLDNGHGAATDIWQATLNVPGMEFDLTPPTISGAVDKVVRAPRKAKRVHVKYKVSAFDDVDGKVPVACKPRSGSRFKVGRRTVVHCSATDTSANTQTAEFAITVRRR